MLLKFRCNDMVVKLDLDKMHAMDGGALIVAACDILSVEGTKNYIHWSDEISVDIAGESHGVMIDYVAGGVRFLKS